MKLPDKLDVIPTKCAKCRNDRIKREQLEMHGKRGFFGPAYRFDVYICENCGYPEIFFTKSTWI